MDTKSIINICEVLEGINSWGQITPAEIVFSEETRDLCRRNDCGKYGASWSCPPALQSVEECKFKCTSFENAVIFNGVYELEDPYDLEGIEAGVYKFYDLCDRLYERVIQLDGEYLLLSTHCRRCAKCTYPDNPCVRSEKLFPALEGCGVIVSATAEKVGLKYINGQNTVTYFGLLLF